MNFIRERVQAVFLYINISLRLIFMKKENHMIAINLMKKI